MILPRDLLRRCASRERPPLGWLEREKHGSGLFNTIRSQPFDRPQQSLMARIFGQWRSMAQLDCLA